MTWGDDDTVKLSIFQRSFIQNMLRKQMASKFIAFGIWQSGVPEFLKENTQLSKQLLQNNAKAMAKWLGRVGQAIQKRRSEENFQEQVRLGGSSYGESALLQDDIDRKCEFECFLEAKVKGKRLREGVDAKTMWYSWLSPEEQDILHRYDTGALDRNIERVKVPRLNKFRM